MADRSSVTHGVSSDGLMRTLFDLCTEKAMEVGECIVDSNGG